MPEFASFVGVIQKCFSLSANLLSPNHLLTSNTGPIILQGPHHEAVKSTTTSLFPARDRMLLNSSYKSESTRNNIFKILNRRGPLDPVCFYEVFWFRGPTVWHDSANPAVQTWHLPRTPWTSCQDHIRLKYLCSAYTTWLNVTQTWRKHLSMNKLDQVKQDHRSFQITW